MARTDLHALAELIRQKRDTLLDQWRAQVQELRGAKDLDTPTLNDHIPALIDSLSASLASRSEETIAEAHAEASPPAHGLQRLRDGFDIEEVVAEYNILRGCIHDLLDANGIALRGSAFHILNRVLDEAVGLAVQTYAEQRAQDERVRREEYLAFVAHDLRTPLSAISMATRVLAALPEHAAPAERDRMFQALSRNVKQLDKLVGRVLHENDHLLTQIGIKLERRAFDLWPLVEALIRDLDPMADESGVRLINEVPADLVIYADANLMRRVFQNLIGNAIRYAPHGEVRIGAREAGEEGHYECWVSDNGSGIPRERLAHVFEKLETEPGKQDASGLGLGLAIVKSFVEAHQGNVSVESDEGRGSTFRFTLPARRSEAGPR